MLRGELEKLSSTDDLTGLGNRRQFEQHRAHLEAGDAVLLIDIDHFKRVNDVWGHAVGDAVIRLVAATLQQHRGKSGQPARYGGEEFALLMPTTALRDAVAQGERLRAALATRRISLRANAEPIGTVTVSVGAARYEPGEPISAWIARADAALYRAKGEGRNRVVALESPVAALP